MCVGWNPTSSSEASSSEFACGRHLSVERGHRNHESRGGTLDYYASKGCFWLRQRYPHNAQSGLRVQVRVDQLQAEMQLGLDDR